MSNAKEEYEQAMEDLGDAVESTTELIDMPFSDYAEYLSDKNVGALNSYRLLMQRNLDQADFMAKQFVESKTTTFGKEDRVKLGSTFGVVSKIIERMGYIDLLLKQRSIN